MLQFFNRIYPKNFCFIFFYFFYDSNSIEQLKLNQIKVDNFHFHKKNSIKIHLNFFVTDTSTNEYFNGKSGLKVPNETVDFTDRTSKNTSQANTQQRKGSLAKLDSVDIVDCKYLFQSL